MGYKVMVSRMVEYAELTKDERIYLAGTTKERELQQLLSKDELPEVRAALVSNPDISEIFIYENLINDSSEEVKNALKTLYSKKPLSSCHWAVYHFSKKLFGKLPSFDKVEHRQALIAFIYISLTKGNVGLEDINFYRVKKYYPYSLGLEYYMWETSNVYMILPQRIDSLEYRFYEETQQKMDELWQNINKEKPNDVTLEEWISVIASFHYRLHYINSDFSVNGDSYKQLGYKFYQKLAYDFVIKHF